MKKYQFEVKMNIFRPQILCITRKCLSWNIDYGKAIWVDWPEMWCLRYSDIIISTPASRITGVAIVYRNFSLGADQREYQSSASLAYMRGIHRWPVNPPQKGLAMLKIFPFDDINDNYVIIECCGDSIWMCIIDEPFAVIEAVVLEPKGGMIGEFAVYVPTTLIVSACDDDDEYFI